MNKAITIMVLDDQELSRTVVRHHLSVAADSMGIAVVIIEVSNPQQAWDRFTTDRPDALVTDVYLGGPVTGVQVAEAFRNEAGAGFPVALVTGITDDENLTRLWDTGWVINKPVRPYLHKQFKYFLRYMQLYMRSIECKAKGATNEAIPEA